MPTLIDQAGRRFDYSTLEQTASAVVLDGATFIAGKLSDFTFENDPAVVGALVADFEAVLDAHIDAQARALRYTNINTAVSYAEEPAVPKFQAEGRALREWRSVIYAAAIQVQNDVLAGTMPTPDSPAALIALLPAFVPPEV